MPNLGLDTFTESANTDLNKHSADSGFGSYEYSGIDTQFVVVAATNDCIKQFAAIQFARSTLDIADDNLRLSVDLTRHTVDGTDDGGIYFLADDAPAAADILGGGVIFFAERSSSTQVQLRIKECNDDATTCQEVTLASNVSLGLGNSLQLGIDLRAHIVTPWSELVGGGSRTTYSTFTLDNVDSELSDGNHRRAGIYGENDFRFDLLTADSLVGTSQSTLEATPAEIGSEETALLSATILSIDSDPSSGVSVVFSSTGSGDSITQPAALSDASGLAEGVLTPGTFGLRTISATADTFALDATDTVDVVAWSGSAGTASVSWSDSSADTFVWAQLSATTEQGDIDFRLQVSEQFPMRVSEDRPLAIEESVISEP